MATKFKNLSFIFTVMLCLSGVAFGQETTGNIEGTIRDPQGAVVPGVEVTVTSTGSTEGARRDATTGFTRSLTTDDEGFFRVLEVPPGFYSVTTATSAGFGAATVNNVEVVLGKTTQVPVGLQVGTSENVVDVIASDAPSIDITDNKLQTNITAQVAELLPKGTNFTSLLTIAPSVRREPGGFQIDGASGAENTFIIDGQEVTNFRTGQLNTNNNLPFQLVQEVQVKSSGFEAEFGGATGGVINVVTKGGNNAFHGEFGIQFEPSELQAGQRQQIRRFTSGSFAGGTFFQSAENFRGIRDGGTSEFPTANLSGPIIKDRLWFFTSYTPQFININRTINFTSPDTRVANRFNSTDTFRYKQRNDYAFARLDSNITDKLRLTGTYTYNPISQEGALPLFGDTFGAPASAVFLDSRGTLTGSQFLGQQGGRQNSQNVTGQGVFTPTSNLVVSVRGGRSYLNEKLNSYGLPTTTRILNSGAGNAQFGATGQSGVDVFTSGQQNFATNFQTNFDISIRKTFDADASYILNNFGGRHQFKGGYQYNGISNNVDQGTRASGGLVQLFFGVPLVDLLGLDGDPNAIGSGRFTRFETRGQASSASQSFFIQDQYQPFNRLTLNLGVRFEKEDVPSFVENAPGISFGLGDKIAPRLGFALDVTGDGRTKIFGSFGFFYDRFKYELPRGSFGGDFFRRDFFDILPGQANGSFFTPGRILGSDQNTANCPRTSPGGITQCQLDFRVPSNSPSDNRIDPDLKAARQREYTIGFERDLGSGFLFAGRYTRKEIDRAIEDVGIFDAQGNELYFIGNPGFGVTAQELLPGVPPTPKAERNYDALELRFDKRFTQSYYFNASYTYSRLIGNYSGLASTDEAGRSSPNVNRFFDLPFLGFDALGRPDNGRLATDRPHAFKFYGAYTLDSNRAFGRNIGQTEFSGFFTGQSGTPLTTFYDFYFAPPVILNGRGDLGRTEKFTQTDLAISHKYRFGNDERFTMAFDFNVLNAFNEANETGRFTSISPTTFTAGNLGIAGVTDETTAIQRIFNGGIRDAVMAALVGRPDRQDFRYNQPNAFQAGRNIRFGFRFLF